jgi:hypothetical protein
VAVTDPNRYDRGKMRARNRLAGRSTDSARSAAALAKLRACCLALPGVTERPSHGMPAWFVGKNQFVVFSNDHHGDGRIALVCAAPDGVQAVLVDSDPDAYYVPPYVGRLGWIGVRLDKRVPWSQVAALVESAHAWRASKRKRGA